MIKLTERLQAVADMVKNGSTVVDVGCDHGYIPAYLVENKICDNVFACDINEAPLNSCRLLVSQTIYENKIKCILSNGLENVPEAYDTVIIAGMGGELISDILEKSDYVKQCSLILNPMSHSETVRKWLYTNGFSIDKDIIVAESKHHYNVILAHYTATFESKSTVDYFFGEIKDFSDKAYFIHLKNYLMNKQKSGADFSSVIKAIEDVL